MEPAAQGPPDPPKKCCNRRCHSTTFGPVAWRQKKSCISCACDKGHANDYFEGEWVSEAVRQTRLRKRSAEDSSSSSSSSSDSSSTSEDEVVKDKGKGTEKESGQKERAAKPQVPNLPSGTKLEDGTKPKGSEKVVPHLKTELSSPRKPEAAATAKMAARVETPSPKGQGSGDSKRKIEEAERATQPAKKPAQTASASASKEEAASKRKIAAAASDTQPAKKPSQTASASGGKEEAASPRRIEEAQGATQPGKKTSQAALYLIDKAIDQEKQKECLKRKLEEQIRQRRTAEDEKEALAKKVRNQKDTLVTSRDAFRSTQAALQKERASRASVVQRLQGELGQAVDKAERERTAAKHQEHQAKRMEKEASAYASEACRLSAEVKRMDDDLRRERMERLRMEEEARQRELQTTALEAAAKQTQDALEQSARNSTQLACVHQDTLKELERVKYEMLQAKNHRRGDSDLDALWGEVITVWTVGVRV